MVDLGQGLSTARGPIPQLNLNQVTGKEGRFTPAQVSLLVNSHEIIQLLGSFL